MKREVEPGIREAARPCISSQSSFPTLSSLGLVLLQLHFYQHTPMNLPTSPHPALGLTALLRMPTTLLVFNIGGLAVPLHLFVLRAESETVGQGRSRAPQSWEPLTCPRRGTQAVPPPSASTSTRRERQIKQFAHLFILEEQLGTLDKRGPWWEKKQSRAKGHP